GQGIALVREQLVKDNLNSGTLIRLFKDMEITSPWSYYIVMPQHSSPKVKQLFDWFVEHGKNL
ncbi:MAG: LysR family transcriptional regulator, partial [Proteobacteria bacterium]|nr:LysR family transcriptional regulator [Pseudomonadota bacterium]